MIKIENSADPTAGAPFRALLTFTEQQLVTGEASPPGPRAAAATEIFTFPITGSFTHSANPGQVIAPGQTLLSSGGAISHPSGPDPSRFLELHFQPRDPAAATPSPRSGKFSEAERDNILCLLASPDARFGSLPLNANVQIYTCHLGAHHQITFRIRVDHHLWLYPIKGSLELGADQNYPVNQWDIATISAEPQITIAANRDSEFILLDLT